MPMTRMEILAGFMTSRTSTTQTTRSRQLPLTQRTQDPIIQLALPQRSVSIFLKYANLDIIMPEAVADPGFPIGGASLIGRGANSRRGYIS